MARDPGSVWAPLPEAGAPDGYEKTQFIVHSTGDNGTAAATARFFAGSTPNESTFIVGQGPQDPTLQIMDSTDLADANMSASARAISVEVVGDGKGGYNAWQRAELIRIGRWARSVHPKIAPRIIPSHTEPGFGWHVMFGAPGPWAGVAKICPGPVRIEELKRDIFPAIFAAGGTLSSDEEIDMSARDDIVGRQDTRIIPGLQRIEASSGAILGIAVPQILGAIAALSEVVKQLATNQGTPIDMVAIEAVVEKGVQDAIEGIETTVSVKTDS